MTLGQRIQELRRQAGLTQEQLAERMGVTRQAVSKWESDGGVPELDTLIAMSRLFHVTIGQLLGVEEPGQSDEGQEKGENRPKGERSTLDEEQVEAILRRYAEATRAQRQAPPMYGRFGWKAPLIAVAGVLALGVSMMVYFGTQIGEIKNTIGNLQANLYYKDDVIQNLGNRIDTMEYRIQSMLEEQASPVSGFEWDVVDFDRDTVTLMWRVSLKEYSDDTQAQVELERDGEGRYTSQWSAAPEFIGYLTEVPMAESYHCKIRVRAGDGRVREYEMDPIGSLAEDEFQLSADSLSALYSISVGNSATATAEDPAARIFSPYPELFRPMSAQLTVTLNGEVLETTTLSLTEEGTGIWYGRDDQGVRQLRLGQEDVLEFSLLMTDNLGRETVCTSTVLGDENAPRESTAPLAID